MLVFCRYSLIHCQEWYFCKRMDYTRCKLYVWKQFILKSFPLLISGSDPWTYGQSHAKTWGNKEIRRQLQMEQTGREEASGREKRYIRKELETNFWHPHCNMPKANGFTLWPTVCSILKFCVPLKLKLLCHQNWKKFKKCPTVQVLRFLTLVLTVSYRKLILTCGADTGKSLQNPQN